MKTIVLTITVVFLCASGVLAQPVSMPQNMTMPPMDENFMRAQEEQYLSSMKEKAPGLYGFQKKLMAIQKEIQSVAKDFSQKKISRQQAVEKLKQLIKQQADITQNPEYAAEQILYQSGEGMMFGMPR